MVAALFGASKSSLVGSRFLFRFDTYTYIYSSIWLEVHLLGACKRRYIAYGKVWLVRLRIYIHVRCDVLIGMFDLRARWRIVVMGNNMFEWEYSERSRFYVLCV